MVLKRRRLVQPTKKMNCPVQIRVTRALCVKPDVVADLKTRKGMARSGQSGQVRCKTRYERTILLSAVKHYFNTVPIADLEEKFLYRLPEIHDHRYHNTGVLAGLTVPVDPLVRQKVKELFRLKNRSVVSIMEFLEEYVEKDLGQKDRLDRRFWPDKRTIRNIIWSVKLKERWSVVDVENTEKFLKDWPRKEDKYYFRRCSKPEECDVEVSGANSPDDDGDIDYITADPKDPLTKDQLLFVYQSTEMRELYRRYGHSGILMDATYRTCKYALPLFFIVVLTNCGYQPVCMFITQRETKRSIIEALTYLSEWNPSVIPLYGLVDYAMEEILALESVWKDMKVFICSFHREQAWTRWTTKRNLGDMSIPVLRSKFRAIANACNERKLNEALEDLMSWTPYLESRAKEYFERTWLSEISRWSLALQPADLLYASTNGVERVHGELKWRYLRDSSKCSLSELLGKVMNEFLPDKFKSYRKANVEMMASHKLYSNDVPAVLRNRPKWLIKRLMKNEEKVKNDGCDATAMVTQISDGRFVVQSRNSEDQYTVSIDGTNSSCTCYDFCRQKLPCKHFFLVGMKEQKFHPYMNLDEILSNPVYCIDESVIAGLPQCVSDSVADSAPDEVCVPAAVQKHVECNARKKVIDECKATIRDFESLMYQVSVEELRRFAGKLEQLTKEFASVVPVDDAGLVRNIPHQESISGKFVNDNGKSVASNLACNIVDGNSVVKDNVCDVVCESSVTNVCDVVCEGSVTDVCDVVREGSVKDVCDVVRASNLTAEATAEIARNQTIVRCTNTQAAKLSLRHRASIARVGAEADRVREGVMNDLCKGIPLNMLSSPASGNEVTVVKQRTVPRRCHNVSAVEVVTQCQIGQELDDLVINCAQECIKHQKKVDGLQDVVLGQQLLFSIQRSGIQILHNGSRHWVTVVMNGRYSVKLYDSVGMNVTDYLKRQIANILGCKQGDRISVERIGVQKQDYNDCGVLAIAFAWTLACGKHPERLTFDPAKLRSHLKYCLESKVFQDFPLTRKAVEKVRPSVFDLFI